MNVIGISGLHQSVAFKRRQFSNLTEREFRIAQGFDSAAALISSGNIIAAAAEERFTRQKTSGAFPCHAIQFCLRQGDMLPGDIDHIAHCFDYPMESMIGQDEYRRRQFQEVYCHEVQRKNLSSFFPDNDWSNKLVTVPHHVAHAASAYYPSGFGEALILVSDGMGESHSATVSIGNGQTINSIMQVPALHSLGILYGVFTLYLGFQFGVDEYKVMGLAPYGNKHTLFKKVMGLVRLNEDGSYAIPLFAYNRTLLDQETHRGALTELENLFGPARQPGSEITRREMDIAAAVQAVFQQCQLHVLGHFRRLTGIKKLCMAGGAALNCSANGAIQRSRLFDQVFIQPASGDDGAALGAALHVAATSETRIKIRRMKTPLWGPEYSRAEIISVLDGRSDCCFTEISDFSDLCRVVANKLVSQEIVGWFQGRMEFGPRALGSRSILADPSDAGMREKINAAVKKRESFRPFAPIVRAELAGKYFDLTESRIEEFAHMLVVAPVRSAYREQLPAVTHVDGSARVQTVSHDNYPQLWELLGAFAEQSGIPVLLNTSFNVKGQPIVCTPEEAIDTFLSSGLDTLVMGNFILTPKAEEIGYAARVAAQGRITLGVG